MADTRALYVISVAAELGSKMQEVVEPVEQQPRPEPLLFAHQHAALRNPAPDYRASVTFRPHRYDSRRRIPTPQPFIAAR